MLLYSWYIWGCVERKILVTWLSLLAKVSGFQSVMNSYWNSNSLLKRAQFSFSSLMKATTTEKNRTHRHSTTFEHCIYCMVLFALNLTMSKLKKEKMEQVIWQLKILSINHKHAKSIFSKYALLKIESSSPIFKTWAIRKTPRKRMKRQFTAWKKIFVNDIANTVLIVRLWRELEKFDI